MPRVALNEIRITTVAFLALGLAACMPYKRPGWVSIPLHQDQVDPDSEDKLQVGETVIVDTLKEKTHTFKVIRLESNGFVGIAKNNRTYTVLYKDLESMWVKRWKWHIATTL